MSLPMTTRRKVTLGVLALALGGAAFVGLRPSSKVASIRATPEYQAPQLLERAWALPVAQQYRRGYEFQRNSSFCGPASVVNVMRSLGSSGEQGTVLDGSGLSQLFGLVLGGVTLDQLSGLARLRLGRQVTVLRGLSLDGFRQHLRRSNDPTVRYLVNFSRAPLFGTGGGHHSPIGGYLEGEDLVFVLDVNEKYGPWLVKSERLLEAMDTVDRATGQQRGLLLIE